MAFNTNPGKQQFTASAGQTIFAFNFAIFADTDIRVYLTPSGNTPDDTADILALSTNYTVAINGTLGGTVTLLVGASINDTITIVRALPINRTTDYVTNGDLYADTLDADQDYQTYLVVDGYTQLQRAIIVPESLGSVVLNIPAPFSNSYLRWNATADALENDTSIPNDVVTSTANAATATTQAGIATTKASEASASASYALSYLNDFKGRYYGALASDPSLDPLGNPLTAGDIYFNTTLSPNRFRGYNGVAWQDTFTADASGISVTPSGLISSTTAQNALTELDAIKANSGYTNYRNRIINGAMNVNQINSLTAVTPSVSGYVSDQWYANISQASKLTFQTVSDAPSGFKYSQKITVNAQYSPLTTDVFTYRQPIEAQNIIDFKLGTAGAVTINTSLHIKGSVAGTYSCSLRNVDNTRSYVGTITVGTTWAKVAINLVGANDGTWATDNTTGLMLAIDLGSGSNYNTTAGVWQNGNFTRTSGSVTFVNQVVGSTLNITGVQLEKVPTGATQGTDYEWLSYNEELKRCQRYYQRFGSSAYALPRFQMYGVAATLHSIPYMLPRRMRVPPTVVVSGTWTATNCSQPTFSSDGIMISHSVNVTATGIFSSTPDTVDDYVELKAQL